MAATDNPSPNTTTAPTDVTRAAEADRRSEASGAAPNASAASSGNELSAPPSNGDGAAAAAPQPGTAPDNSRMNQRDRDNATLTPGDQGTSEGDRKLTQQIRQAVMKDDSLSFTAKNIKIITVDGKVTLRGPVNSERERSAIEAAAKKIAGVQRVDNLLEIKP